MRSLCFCLIQKDPSTYFMLYLASIEGLYLAFYTSLFSTPVSHLWPLYNACINKCALHDNNMVIASSEIVRHVDWYEVVGHTYSKHGNILSAGFPHNPYNGVVCNDTITATGVFGSSELWKLSKGNISCIHFILDSPLLAE